MHSTSGNAQYLHFVRGVPDVFHLVYTKSWEENISPSSRPGRARRTVTRTPRPSMSPPSSGRWETTSLWTSRSSLQFKWMNWIVSFLSVMLKLQQRLIRCYYCVVFHHVPFHFSAHDQSLGGQIRQLVDSIKVEGCQIGKLANRNVSFLAKELKFKESKSRKYPWVSISWYFTHLIPHFHYYQTAFTPMNLLRKTIVSRSFIF